MRQILAGIVLAEKVAWNTLLKQPGSAAETVMAAYVPSGTLV